MGNVIDIVFVLMHKMLSYFLMFKFIKGKDTNSISLLSKNLNLNT